MNTIMTRTMGTMGRWDGRIACTTRNFLTRAMRLSLHLRQFARPAIATSTMPGQPWPALASLAGSQQPRPWQ